MSISTPLLACSAVFSVCTATHGILLNIVIILSIMAGILLTFSMILSLLLFFGLFKPDKEERIQGKEGTLGPAESVLERPEPPESQNTSNATKQEVTNVSPPLELCPSSSLKPLFVVLGDTIKENYALGVLIAIHLVFFLILFFLFGLRLWHGGEGPILITRDTNTAELALERAMADGSRSHPSLTPSVAAVSVEGFDQGQDVEFHPEVRALVEEGNFTKEAVQHLKPVALKPGTVIPDYNRVLDETRPETMDEYFNEYRIFFVIDDSGSMAVRWDETRDALSEIADYALTYHSNAIDIRFFNSRHLSRGVQGMNQVMDIFASVSPSGWTPTGRVLSEVLIEQLDRLENAQRDGSYSSERPLDVIVLTDGVPNSDLPPAVVIENAAKQLKSMGHHQNWVSIQFVQIGDNPRAEPTLLSLIDCANNNHMVDTISYSLYKDEGGGKLTPQILERIVLGGLHPNLRSYYNQYRRKMNEGPTPPANE